MGAEPGTQLCSLQTKLEPGTGSAPFGWSAGGGPSVHVTHAVYFSTGVSSRVSKNVQIFLRIQLNRNGVMV